MAPRDPLAVAEEELVAQARAGDPDALTALLRRHGPAARALVEQQLSRKWRRLLDSDDVMQVTYLEAFLRIDGFVPRGDGAFAAWLKRMALNNLRDALRGLGRQKRGRPQHQLEAAAGATDSRTALLETLGCTTTTAGQQLAQCEVHLALESALLALPDDYQTVVRFLDLDQLAAPEVARLLGRSTGAIFMLRARAHDRLRELMGGQSRFFSDSP